MDRLAALRISLLKSEEPNHQLAMHAPDSIFRNAIGRVASTGRQASAACGRQQQPSRACDGNRARLRPSDLQPLEGRLASGRRTWRSPAGLEGCRAFRRLRGRAPSVGRSMRRYSYTGVLEWVGRRRFRVTPDGRLVGGNIGR